MTETAKDDARVAQALRSSALLGPADRAVETLWRAGTQARSVSSVGEWLAQWRELSESDRRKNVALLLWSSATTATALTMFYQSPAGWMWLLPQAAAASVGLLLFIRSLK